MVYFMWYVYTTCISTGGDMLLRGGAMVSAPLGRTVQLDTGGRNDDGIQL